jgi:hypothetical protein
MRLVCAVCFSGLAEFGCRCSDCAFIFEGKSASAPARRGKRRPPELPDLDELLALAEADPVAALETLGS